MENLHYYSRECCYCSVTGCPPIQSLLAIKRWERGLLLEAPVFWNYGLHLVFLLLPSWKLCSVFQRKILKECLWVAREVSAAKPCNPASLSGSMLDIMSLHIPMKQVLRGRVVSSCVILLGFPGCEYPRTDISGVETKSCHNVFRKKEKFFCKMQEEILQGVYCNLPPCT